MIRLLIADDHEIVRASLKRALAEFEDIQIVGEAPDQGQVLSWLGRESVDVVLFDLSLSRIGFFRLLAMARAVCPNVSILIYSSQPPEMYTAPTLRAGAAGYVGKDSTPQELAEAIRRAANLSRDQRAKDAAVGSIQDYEVTVDELR